jgi:hypothetical protein
MLQKVNTVFVGKQSYVTAKNPSDANTLTVGDIVMINPANGTIIASNGLSSSIPTIQLGYVKSVGTLIQDAVIEKSAPISKDKIKSITPNGTCAYVANTEASSVIDITGATITVGHRYVARIVYNDLYEHPGQFTHSYEAIAATGETAITLANKLYTRINAHAGRRVTAYNAYFSGTVAGVSPAATIVGSGAGITANVVLTADSVSTLAQLIAAHNAANPTQTLTLIGGESTDVPTANITVEAGVIYLAALSVVDNGFSTQGKEAITPYSQVQMDVYLYKTNPTTPRSNVYEVVPGATVATVKSAPGRGNKYIVRDREQAALAYRGITYRTEWPVIKPELNVDLTKNYDTLVIEFSNNYQSPDNQYVKSTDFASEVYIDTVGGAGDAEVLRDAIATWAGL